MTDPAELAQAVFERFNDFVRGLSAEQLAELATGSAKLELVRPDVRTPSAAGARKAPLPGVILPVPAGDVRAKLVGMADRAAARRYLGTELRLTVAQARELAKELGIAVGSKATKTEVLDTIVQWTVGRRLDSKAISRPTRSRRA